MSQAHAESRGRRQVSAAVAGLVSLLACAAACALLLTAGGIGRAVHDHGRNVAVFAAIALVLQAVSVRAFGSTVGAAGLGLIAMGFAFGAAPAMAAAVLAAGVHAARRRPMLHKAVFNAACFTLATGAAAGVYDVVGGRSAPPYAQILTAVLASVVFLVVNVGLLTVAMATADQLPALATWRERLRWCSPLYLAFGPAALLGVALYRQAGLVGILALAGLAVLMTAAMRRTLGRKRSRLAHAS
jgi:hypothetical protein